ncbi:hypothetical protein Ancab_035625 [Ancistrocladus abbreviatus]
MKQRPGIGGLKTAAAAKDLCRLLDENVAKLRSDLMKEQLATFRSHLEEFARKREVKSKNIAREPVSEDDCLRAISKLKALGNGFEVIFVGEKKLVRITMKFWSWPRFRDFVILYILFALFSCFGSPNGSGSSIVPFLVFVLAQGVVTGEEVERRLSWSAGHAVDALDTLLDEGLAMIDDGNRDGKRRYWFPCISSASSTIGTDAIKL